MPFKKDEVVLFHYTVTNDNGDVVDNSRDGNPMAVMAGRGQILPKLEEAMQELPLNEKKVVKLEAKDAYGEFSEENIQLAGRENFPKDAKLEVGMEYMASMEDGHHMPFVITKIESNEITCDFNHPLAGQNLTFDVEIVEKREASAEELEHGHAHGPGGHHHH